jgi:hypothetical protein
VKCISGDTADFSEVDQERSVCGGFVNQCKLPIAFHHLSSSIPVSPTEGLGHCFVNDRRLRQPRHPFRLLGVLEFSSSSLSTRPPCCSHRSRTSLCVSAVTGFGCDSLAKPRARSSLASNRFIQCSPPVRPSVRPAKEAAIAVFRHCNRAVIESLFIQLLTWPIGNIAVSLSGHMSVQMPALSDSVAVRVGIRPPILP